MKYLISLFLLFAFDANATVTTSCTPARTSGVAPLAVFFDCTATTSTLYPTGTGTGYLTNGTFAQAVTSINVNTGTGTIAVGDYIQITGDSNQYKIATTTGSPVTNFTIPAPGVIPAAGWGSGIAVTVIKNERNFNNIRCETNFGDPNGSTVNGKYWLNGTGYNTSRNYATGLVAAHVYEVAGTYTATTICGDTNGTVGNTVTNTITVSALTAANTYCISATTTQSGTSDGSIPGCPSGATLIGPQASWATIESSYALTNKTVLLKRGDTFTHSTNTNIGQAGPGIIGAYGTGALPLISESASAGCAIKFNATTDWRVMDLQIDGTGTLTAFGVCIVTSASQITVLRMTGTNLASAVDIDVAASNDWAVVDSTVSSPTVNGSNSSFGFYHTSGSRLAILGNNVDVSQAGTIFNHGFRTQGSVGLIMSNNTMLGSADAATVRGNSSNGIISDNKFTGNGSSSSLITNIPQNDASNESQRQIIWERNWLIAGSATTTGLFISAVSITARNNVVDMSLSPGTGPSAFQVKYTNTSGSPQPDRLYLYNNTVYSSSATSGMRVAFYNTGLTAACHSTLNNNLGYCPSCGTTPVLLLNSASCAVTGASGTLGNSSDAEIKSATSPFNVVPASLLDFRNIKSGTANNSTDGAVTLFPAIFDDFLHCKDNTATNFRSGAFVPAANAICRR